MAPRRGMSALFMTGPIMPTTWPAALRKMERLILVLHQLMKEFPVFDADGAKFLQRALGGPLDPLVRVHLAEEQ